MVRRIPLVAIVVVMVGALALAMLVAVGVGSVTIPLGRTWAVVTGHGDPIDARILLDYRIPRVLLAALAGAGLSIAGAVLQTLVTNPLADPYVLGISSGASVGAVLVMIVGVSGLGVSTAAFAGAMAAALLVFALGQRRGRLTPTRLVLAGVAVGSVLLAVTSYVQLRADPAELKKVMFWMLGSVAGAHWEQLPPVAATVLACTLGLILYGRRLNALVTGEESATALGIDVRRARIALLVVSSLLTGAVVAVAGGIGFVGLMIPHLVRLAFGTDHRRLLPLAALVGAIFMVLVDLLSRTADRPSELPLGIFTAVFGAPFFLWLLRREEA